VKTVNFAHPNLSLVVDAPGDLYDRELTDRIRSAFIASGLPWRDNHLSWTLTRPMAHHDLAAVAAVLAVNLLVDLPELASCTFWGEVALNGRIRGGCVRDDGPEPYPFDSPYALAFDDLASFVVWFPPYFRSRKTSLAATTAATTGPARSLAGGAGHPSTTKEHTP